VSEDLPAPQAGVSPVALKIFISYRQEDSQYPARDLNRVLREEFGAENVFFDVDVLRPGMDWRRSVSDRAGSCGVLLALIGPKWLSLLHARSQANVVAAVEDVMRTEIHLALTSSANITVLPILLDGCLMPAADQLPRNLQALPDQQAAKLRLTEWEADVERLVGDLRRIAAQKFVADPQPARVAAAATPVARGAVPVARRGPHDHYASVAGHLMNDGNVVVVLGSGVNTDRGQLSDSARLAADLAARFAYRARSGQLGLSEVAQYVDVMMGRPDLCRMLEKQLTVESEPTRVHRFLAGLPARLERLGSERRHQLILTTNFDTALERAFEDAKQPYDLAVYLAAGPDKGKFAHLPLDGERDPVTVDVPNSYTRFPINDDLDLTRTLIVKIHGTVDDRRYGWRSNYVITEDNYIDYLSGSPVATLIPFQILAALQNSHCLFLGYDIGDWNVRIFLKRIWGKEFSNRSWAVQEEADDFQRELWEQWRRVDFRAEPLDQYVEALTASMTSGE